MQVVSLTLNRLEMPAAQAGARARCKSSYHTDMGQSFTTTLNCAKPREMRVPTTSQSPQAAQSDVVFQAKEANWLEVPFEPGMTRACQMLLCACSSNRTRVVSSRSP